jgi:hypothetical protein
MSSVTVLKCDRCGEPIPDGTRFYTVTARVERFRVVANAGVPLGDEEVKQRDFCSEHCVVDTVRALMHTAA